MMATPFLILSYVESGYHVEGWQRAFESEKTLWGWQLSMNISVIIWNGPAACFAYSCYLVSYGCDRDQLYALSCCCNYEPLKAAGYLVVRVWESTLPYLLAQLRNILASNNQRGGNPSPSPYNYFINMNKMIILTTQYYIQPYLVGSDKRSLALILPSKLVKLLNINPLTILFLLKVAGLDELHLKIIRQEDLERNIEKTTVNVAEQEVQQN